MWGLSGRQVLLTGGASGIGWQRKVAASGSWTSLRPGPWKPCAAAAVPLKRIGQPEDYPGTIAFLLSDGAAYITGQTISVSDGPTMS